MKIALILEQLDPTRGGAEQSTAEMARLLARHGMDVTLITGCAQAGIDDVELVDLGTESTCAFICQAEALIHRRSFDIVHAVTPVRSAGIYQLRAGLIDETFQRNVARRTGLSAVVRQCVGPSLKQRRLRRIERHLARHTECLFLAVSEYVRRQCRRHLGLPDDRVRVIYNGVDTDRLAEPIDAELLRHLRTVFRIRNDQLLALFVANNLKLKGFDPLLAALKHLRETEPAVLERLKVAVVTANNFWPAYKKTQRLGLDKHVLFIGPARDMARLYRLADCLVHPTWYDPCSRVVLEAIACELPSITSHYNGAAEIVRHAGCGIVIEDLRNPAELADALKTLADTDRRGQFAEKCGAAHARISMARHVQELVALYKELKTR